MTDAEELQNYRQAISDLVGIVERFLGAAVPLIMDEFHACDHDVNSIDWSRIASKPSMRALIESVSQGPEFARFKSSALVQELTERGKEIASNVSRQMACH